MSICRLQSLVRWASLCCLLLVVTGAAASAADPAGGMARLETYSPASGDGYFALSLVPNPSAKPTEAVGHDVLVVVDTSASQVNRFRDKSLEAVEFFLSSLGPNDRVQLAAVDLNFIPLTKSFVAVQGPEMTQAMAELRARTPLATTDMAGMLKASAEAFAAEAVPGRARAVAYIGDGMSAANLLASGEMQTLVDGLVAKRVAVSSFAIGPRLDLQLLGVMANHTGGLLVVDQDDPNGATINGKQAGNLLAQAATGAVVWPTKAALPASFKEAYPKNFPPLRFDRDTIVVGVGTVTGRVDLSVAAEVQGKPTQLAWLTDAIAAADDHAYLPELIAKVRTDGGITLPTVGSAGLGALRSLAFSEAYQLLSLAKQASTLGNYDEAQRMVDEALRLDPNNGESQAVRRAILQAKADGKGRGPRELKLVNFQPQPVGEAVPAPAGGAAPALEPVPGSKNDEDDQPGALVNTASKDRKIIIEMTQTRVQKGVNDARGMMDRSPDAARALLKALADEVLGVPELDGSTKAQLLEQIQTALRTADRQAKVEEERRIQRQSVIARQQEQDRLYNDLMVREQKAGQLMARFENLMDERRYRDAMNLAEKAAEISDRQAPRSGVSNAHLKDLHDKLAVIQRQKFQGFADSVYGIERSHIPFADDPPIVYPAKEVWEMLTERRAKWDRVDVSSSNEAEIRIREELDKKTEVQYLETPLGDVVTDLKLRHKINIELDTEALAADGKGTDTPISKTLKDVSLRSALRLILEGQGLTYLIKNEVMLVTTKAAASSPENLETRVYPVADLVVPIPKGGLSGFGALGGGMMGGGGGMGGGGMGGMGGGMGGGGMGGGGGGGGGFFAVEDELRLSGPSAKPTSSPAPVVAPAPAADVAAPAPVVEAPSVLVQPIRLKLEPNADVEKAWDDHFAAKEESPAVVRTTIRVLMKEQQPRQAAAVIMAAIKNRQAQPWMYEALGLAMEMQGARVGEIERALMSAVDFSTQPDDLLQVAEYMVKSNLGGGHLQKRALELYRQVARMQPTRPEPYVLGLRIARHLDDAEGLKWATLGILAQAWTGDQRVVFDEAQRVANALLEKLRVEKRTAEADAFQTALKNALVRDCVINVSWAGDADVDLVVEEPAGTLCSFRTPRTTSGGVLIGDAFDKSTNLHTETYICPQGFNGDYRMLAKRVWGKVTAETLTVEVIAHAGSANERRIRKQIGLQDDQAAMSFDMQNARRTEALKDVQVANAVQGQMALGQQILAQQLSLANDPRYGSGSNPYLNPRAFLRGAVGYQPVIISLPTGANMSMVAVVSHDRRYVRVSPQPMFSTIPSVNTFNYSSGSSGTSNGSNSGPS